MSDRLLVLAFAALIASPATAGTVAPPRLGVPADPARLAAWDIDIAPDGKGLPDGSGSVGEGAQIFTAKCEVCHGAAGQGGAADRLTGGIGSLTTDHPVKTVASYWPYATTLFSFIRAAMPITNPRSLSGTEVYALCAYLLSVDGIVSKDTVLDHKTLPAIAMPNRNGFRSMWKER